MTLTIVTIAATAGDRRILCMQALKAASQQSKALFHPTDHPLLDLVPPKETPGQSPSHPQEVTPAKHTPSAEQAAILALTSSSKAAAKEAAVTSKQQQQPLSFLLGNDAASAAVETGQELMQGQDKSLFVIHRQLSEEFEHEESVAESVADEAQSELDSIEVCTCLSF